MTTPDTDLVPLAEFPGHRLDPADALYLVKNLEPVSYYGIAPSGHIMVDRATAGGTSVAVALVGRSDLLIRPGHRRTLPPPRPAPAAPAPAAQHTRTTAAAPAHNAPSRAVATPSARGATAAPPSVKAYFAANNAAMRDAQSLAAAIMDLQSSAAAAGRRLSPSQALEILRTRGQAPAATSSKPSGGTNGR